MKQKINERKLITREHHYALFVISVEFIVHLVHAL
ncbi:hypothetical protein SJPD1_1556 [Sulfurospirillum diekertiae]|uniref:Uncharacterized protein n=1 Tax=Sulfurospirillum diekertiae TaxID=1854492 RepID=A0A290HE28_9BACT|nr:hypothetical protein SJPD1_1556 [Sulfurospirillum diekertiae]